MAKRRRRRRTVKKVEVVRKPRRKLKVPQVEVPSTVAREIMGIMYVVMAVLTAFSLQGAAGPVGELWSHLLTSIVGVWGTWLFIGVFGILGGMIVFVRDLSFNFTRIFGITLLFVSFLGLLQLNSGIDETTILSIKENGGYIGFMVAVLLNTWFAEAARYILFAAMLVGIGVTFEYSIREIISYLKVSVTEKPEDIFAKAASKETTKTTKHAQPSLFEEELAKANQRTAKKKKTKDTEEFAIHTNRIEPVVQQTDISVMEAALRQKKGSASSEVDAKGIDINATIDENYKWEFPSVDILENPKGEIKLNDKYLRDNAKKIEMKLNQFGIKVKVRDVKVGPTVMQYSLEPAEDVKLSKITNLRDDLKLALASESLRIEAPIPGQALVGIEIPNEKRTDVMLKELLLSDEFYKVQSNIRLPLGKDVSGAPVVADLAKMPHVLLAGQTGAGKSVGVNSMIISLLYQNSPRDLRMILIDPKRVELKLYNHIPHLLTPVITEVDKAVNALKWLVAEMMRRYGELETLGVRNREEYNQRVEKEKRIPQIVCVIEELAELMMGGDKKAIEGYICRIAQLARAVGIHLIIATQRPSVDVITGLIKANIPARISYRVASQVDSRTVLDAIGAEDLLGKGDMLFIAGNVSEPTRIQGIYMSTEQVEKVVNHVKLTPDEQEDVHYVDEIINPTEDSGWNGSILSGEGGGDELLSQAIEVLQATGKASTSLLQRRLKIGYSRAARILDDLEEKGVVGPAEGSKPRKVFLDALGTDPMVHAEESMPS